MTFIVTEIIKRVYSLMVVTQKVNHSQDLEVTPGASVHGGGICERLSLDFSKERTNVIFLFFFFIEQGFKVKDLCHPVSVSLFSLSTLLVCS